MKSLRLIVVSTLIFATWNASRAEDPIPIRVLYAGNPGSARERDFVGSLKPLFSKVESTDYESFREEQARNYDVVIFDWTSVYPRDADGKILKDFDMLKAPKLPAISGKYDRPTVLIGYAGVAIAKELKLKIDWRCLCLDTYAHAMATAHEIFQRPLKVEPTLETITTPSDMVNPYYTSQAVGKTIQAWKVQTKELPEIDPGMLSNESSFEDTPDSEIIASGGLSSRGLGSVSLGRHGNFFLWGFSASPSDMTPEGRRCFTNVICYIKKFDCQKPVAHLAEHNFSRKGALLDAEQAKATLDPELFKQKHGNLATTPEALEKRRRTFLSMLEKNFPEAVRQRATGDPDFILKWVKDNYDWIYPGPDHDGIIEISVDDDAKAVGPPNSKVELLEACVAMLEKGTSIDLASRVLKRYTVEDFADAKAWRNWLDTNRGRIFFTEAGGYKFLVAPASLTPTPRLPRLPLTATLTPTRRNPVVATLECSPIKVKAGDSITVVVSVETAPDWHITALEGSRGPEVSTSLHLTLPSGFEAEGQWESPEPSRTASGLLYHEGSFGFRRKVRVLAGAAAGQAVVACRMGYQACDPASCRPLDRLTIETKVEVIGTGSAP